MLLNHAPQPYSLTMLLNHPPKLWSLTMVLNPALVLDLRGICTVDEWKFPYCNVYDFTEIFHTANVRPYIYFSFHIFSANQDYSSRRIGQMRPTIHHDGNVTLDCPVLLNTICQVDVLHYPLDRQKCNLVFGSWSHNSDQMSVKSKVNLDLCQNCIRATYQYSTKMHCGWVGFKKWKNIFWRTKHWFCEREE
jgi:hypothetical protein